MFPRSRIPPRALDRLAAIVGLLLAGCGALPTAGPTTSDVINQESRDSPAQFQVVDISDRVIDVLLAAPKETLRGRFRAHGLPPEPRIGVGDSLVVSIWEAADGGLFSASAAGHVVSGSRNVTLPEQVVGRDGAISIPFAGRVRVIGKLPAEVQQAIQRRLAGKAIDPQVIVTVSSSVGNTVTVTGEVIKGARLPLSLKGDRLLDLIAAAGGPRSPVYETGVRLSRGGVTAMIPMEALVADPGENIYAEPGDVLTVVRAPQSFAVFGATGQNNEINFPAAKVTLAEALAKAGGLQDLRSDPAGVFLFRYEPPAVAGALGRKPAGPDGPTAVVYRLDLSQAKAYFLAGRFPIEDKDIIYVANASLTELQKFLQLLNTATGPVVTGVVIRNAAP